MSLATSPCDPLTPNVALWRRIGARAVDGFLVLFIALGLVVMGFAGVMAAATRSVAPQPWGTGFAALAFHTTVWLLYEVFFTAARGQTPGKDLCNIKVVSVRTGETPGCLRSLSRGLVFSITRIIPGLGAAAVAVAALGVPTLVGERRRSLADLVAGTMVIHYNSDVMEESTVHVDNDDFQRRYGSRWWFARPIRQWEEKA